MFPFTDAKPKYDKLSTDADCEQNDALLDASPKTSPRIQGYGVMYTLVISNFVTALIIIAILIREGKHTENGFEMGYHTDFGMLVYSSSWWRTDLIFYRASSRAY